LSASLPLRAAGAVAAAAASLPLRAAGAAVAAAASSGKSTYRTVNRDFQSIFDKKKISKFKIQI
jgi:NADPH-dependent curcumin reductase CurA